MIQPPSTNLLTREAEQLTIADLLRLAAERQADKYYRLELLENGQPIGNIFVVLDPQTAERMRKAAK